MKIYIIILFVLFNYFQSENKDITINNVVAGNLLYNCYKTSSEVSHIKKVIIINHFDDYDSLGNILRDTVSKKEEYIINPKEGFIYKTGDLSLYSSKKHLITIKQKDKLIFVKKNEDDLIFPDLFGFTKSKTNVKDSLVCQKFTENEKTTISILDTIHNVYKQICYNNSNNLIYSSNNK